MATSWKQSLSVYRNPKMLVMLSLGLFSGLPFILVFSTLSFWLADCGVDVKAVAAFSLVRLPYSFKFLWAPYIDRVPLPFLTKRFGQRRSWALLFQTGLMAALIALVQTAPAEHPMITAVCAVLVAFFSASQDIVFDAFRIEYIKEEQQGAAAATFVFGYRIGMLIAGAGALYLADIIDWTSVYELMALSGLIGMATILLCAEPTTPVAPKKTNFFKDAVIAPLADFLKKPEWWLIALFLITYKMCETSIGSVTPKLYRDLGFTKTQIATIVKLWGLSATIFGGFLGGILVVRLGLIRSLFVCGILQGVSNLPFAALAVNGDSMLWLTTAIVSDNIATGMATSAFVAYMSSLCNKSYTATQYALLSSFTALPRDLLAAGSGWLVSAMGWARFFVFTAFLSLPGLFVLWCLNRRQGQNQPETSADKP